MLKLGETGISALRLGETEIKKAYLGDALVFGEKKPSRLPAGYTEVEYITIGSDTSYFEINTAIRTNSRLECVCEITELPTSGYKYLFNYSMGNGDWLLLDLTKSQLRACCNTSTSYAANISINASMLPCSVNLLVDLSPSAASAKKLYLNNVTATAKWSTTTQYTLRIGKGTAASTKAILGCRIKYIKMSTTTYAQSSSSFPKFNCELIPCTNARGLACLYDLTNKKVYTPNGSFTAGPAV